MQQQKVAAGPRAEQDSGHGGTNGPADEEYPGTGSSYRDLFHDYLDARRRAAGHWIPLLIEPI
jgi:hypothetical protein